MVRRERWYSRGRRPTLNLKGDKMEAVLLFVLTVIVVAGCIAAIPLYIHLTTKNGLYK
jgi:hypothetical protein